MSIAEKLTTIAENVPKVYEAGKQAEYEKFWKSYLSSGYASYHPYRFAGQGWNDITFKPKYNIITGSMGATGMFRECQITNLKQILEDCGVILDTSLATNLNYAFAYNRITHFPKISLISATNKTDGIFVNNSGNSKIISIDEIELAETTAFKSTSFQSCSLLEHVIFTGTLATNGLNISWSTLLDKESLLSILNCLKDYSQDTSGTTYYITIGAENIAKLTEEEKLIATNKGWDIR